ncbi:hypothetical protein CcCBS67573_g06996 [Chytriomyces confervae]|uniref:G-protein coupled receptors family 1 profile domain-containing protein n=1 Tax=Chytriomyces confervae TaxID=246404 RepID=A0A507F017_9FUNG|nr:hypothetical protein HDU80_006622 [Chytriomyces hyalinus]TPX68967.1 hypothetical protein CcCBS67573_g06996 [Chytriomyces confervae]
MDARDWTYSTTTTTIATIGILVNSIVIVPNVWRVRSLTPSSLLIVCLCCSDSLLLSNYLTLAATHLRRGDLEYNPIICQIHGFLITFGALWSLGLCTGLTLFRYIIIIHKKTVSHRFAYAYLFGTATFCALLAGLPFICNAGDRIYVLHQTHMNCTVAWSNTDTTTRVISWICISVLLIPVSSMGVAYIRIYSEVSKVFGAYSKSAVVTGDDLSGNQQRGSKTINQDSKHQEGHRPSRVATNPCKETNETTGTVESMKPSVDEESLQPPKMLKKRKLREEEAKQMALLMQSIAIVGVFLMGWTPFLFATVYEIITGTKAHPDFEFAGEMFVAMNDLLNPVVVMVFDDKIRRNVIQFFTCAEDEKTSY